MLRYLRYIQSKITISKFVAFIVCILITLSIFYHILLHESQPQSTVVYINNNFPVKPAISYIYSDIKSDKFKFEYVPKLSDNAREPRACLIIVRSADGGIGNRMFLFASAYGLARLHQCDLYVAPWILTDLRSIFTVQLNHTPIHLITNKTVLNQTGIYERYSSCTLFLDLMKIPLKSNFTRYEMTGFYQAFGYFNKYRNEVSYLFKFNRGTIANIVPLVEQLLKAVWDIPLNLNNYTKETVTHQYLKSLLTHPSAPLIPVTWIGIHIRRGDFLTFFKIDTNIDYVNMAMDYYRRKYINCRFLISSDDKDYVKDNFGKNNSDVVITPKTFFSGDDLAALTLCEHTIVTAGTYGWWAGWLAGGNVLHDLNYPVPSQNCQREHYFPPWFLFPHASLNKPKNSSISGNKTKTIH